MANTQVKRIVSELRKTKDQVLYLLEKYPRTRDNDFYLTLLWLKIFGGLNDYIQFVPYNVIMGLSGSLESIRRVRAKIQNEHGLFPPTDPEIRRKRQSKARSYRKAIGRI